MDSQQETKIPRKPVPSASTVAHHVDEPQDGIAGVAQPLLDHGTRSRGNRCWTGFYDCILTIPGAAFLTYAILIIVYTGKPVTESPLPMLAEAAAYGPTVFPIAFAAVAANLLKSYATWRLERGISRLDLEYLLGSRTVVSALIAPFALKSLSFLAPILAVIWAMSPLGGQASLRVMQTAPNVDSAAHKFQWLEYMSMFPHQGPGSSAGIDTLPGVVGTFSAALTTPMDIKKAPQDLFGNVKIPLVEAYTASEVTPDPEGWYVVDSLDNEDGIRYAALVGLPMTAEDSLTQAANYSLIIDTSYLYAECAVSLVPDITWNDWFDLKNTTTQMTYTNDKTLLITEANVAGHGYYSESPFNMIFTSWTSNAVSNATCSLTMSHVQADVFCHRSACEAIRIRPTTRAENVTIITVLDGIDRNGKLIGNQIIAPFFRSLLGATQTYWEHKWPADSYSTPIEYYFTHPESPFTPPTTAGWRGADIYPIGSALFSYRFTQILNTFWLANIATAVLGSGDLKFNNTLADDPSLPQHPPPGQLSPYFYSVHGAAGTITPDILIMRPNRPWLAVLILSSSLMLAAGVTGAAFELLREAPDVLDRATGMLDYHYHAPTMVRIGPETSPKSLPWSQQQVRLDLGREG